MINVLIIDKMTSTIHCFQIGPMPWNLFKIQSFAININFFVIFNPNLPVQSYMYSNCTFSSVAIFVYVSLTNCCGNRLRDFYLVNALNINFWPLFIVWTLTWSEDDLATSFLYVVMDSGRKLPLLDQIRHVIVRLNGWIFRVLYLWVRLIDGYKIQERVFCSWIIIGITQSSKLRFFFIPNG